MQEKTDDKLSAQLSETSEQTPDLIADFERLAANLKDAVKRFQDDQTPESFAGIVSSLSSFGLSATDIWQRVADYGRRYPLRVAGVAALIFFAMKGVNTMRPGANHEPTVH